MYVSRRWIVGAAVAALGLTAWATAQESEPKSGGSDQATKNDDGQQDTSERAKRRIEGRARRRAWERGMINPHQHLARIDKLQDELHARLGLSEDQADAVDERFEQHFATVEKLVVGEFEKEVMEDALVRIKDAQAAGDTEGLLLLRDELEALQDRRYEQLREATELLLTNLETELDEEQRTEFQKIAGRLQIVPTEGPDSPTARLFMKAVMHPDVHLTLEQKHEIRTIMREGWRHLREERKTTSSENAFEEIRTQILGQLTEAQRITLEEKIKELRERARRTKVGAGKPHEGKSETEPGPDDD